MLILSYAPEHQEGRSASRYWPSFSFPHRSRVCILVDDLDFTPRKGAAQQPAAPAEAIDDALAEEEIPF